MSDQLFLGIDVGTGSARAGLFDAAGTLVASAVRDIQMWRDAGGIVEQSSDNIWEMICSAVKEIVSQVDPMCVAGIGFDATCSLVVLGDEDQPLAVGPLGNPARNIIVWMDQRATDQANRINATKHSVLDFVGGRISPEMETPKLLWLRENLPETFSKARHFFDLTDFLTWRATGDTSRSVCTVTCKWTYLAHENRWDSSYFEAVGLGDFVQEGFSRIGTSIVDPGTKLGRGLSAAAALDLGLPEGVPVAAGLIDAHAGGVGTIGAKGGKPENRMAYVFGTSACTMTSATERTLVPGVWGPYYSAMVPGLWLAEGGQSAAGEAIALLVKMHPHYEASCAAAEAAGQSLPNFLLSYVESEWGTAAQAVAAAEPLMVVPDFLGNRAPLADPSARAIIAGLGAESDLRSHVALYVAGLAGVGYGLRQILDVQAAEGLKPDTVVLSGGAGRSPLIRQLLADAANITIADPTTDEPVLLGSAMLGAVASGTYGSIREAMAAMSSIGTSQTPGGGATAELHNKRYERFKALQAAARGSTLD